MVFNIFKSKKYLISLILFISVLFILPRLPFITNLLEQELIKELNEATSLDFSVKKLSVNLIPLFARGEGISGLNKSGTVKIEAGQVKVYVGLQNILQKEISLNRLLIRDLIISGEKKDIDPIVDSIKTYLKKDTDKKINVVVRSVDIETGAISITEGDKRLSVDSLNLSVQPDKDLRARVFLKDLIVQSDSFKDIKADLRANLRTSMDDILIDSLNMNIHQSEIKTSATLKKTNLMGPITLEANLLWDDIKRIFGLKNDGSGFIETKGTVNINPKKDILEALNIDLKVKGEFFLETLMELLKVTEPLKGYMYVDGSVRGLLKDLEGIGRGHLKRGNIFDVAIDDLSCDIYYKAGSMRFTRGKAGLYKGMADVNVMIALPVVNYFEVDVKVKDISSKGLFQIIKWDPGIAEGLMSGSLVSKGRLFNPSGHLHYSNNKSGLDILSGIRKIDLNYSFNDEVITLSDMNIKSERSFIKGGGVVDLRKNKLNLSADGKTDDVLELTTPYFTALSGSAGLSFTVQGDIDDPVVDLLFDSTKGLFDTKQLGYNDVLNNHKINITSSKGRIRYKKDLLIAPYVDFQTDYGHFSISGDIRFPKAKRLFDLVSPIHNLTFTIEQGDLGRISKLFVDSPPMNGILDTQFSLTGIPKDLKSKGHFKVSDYELYGYATNSLLSSSISYSNRLFVFNDATLRGFKNEIKGRGSISLDKDFSISLKADNFSLNHMMKRFAFLRDTTLKNLNIQGKGTLDEPLIDARAQVNFRSQQKAYTVKGDLIVSMSGDKVSLQSSLFDNKINIVGEVSTKAEMPWTVKADLKTTRYDFFIASLLKDIPDDLVLTLNGAVSLWGDKKSINGNMRFNRTYLNIYGNGFSNKGDVLVSVDNNKILLNNLILYNDNSEFKASGGLTIGEKYDLLFEGHSSLAPLKALSVNIDAIKGDSKFVLSVAGDWNEPKINGGIEINNGTLGFKTIYYSLTSLSAYAYFDENKVIISKAVGKIAGGDVNLKGNINLNNFNINKFFIEMNVKNATIAPSSDFWLNVNGDLYLRGDLQEQQIIGDVKVNSGKYTERIDWKTWLISASKIEKTKVDIGKLEKVSLNLKLSGGNISIDNNISRTTITVDLLLRGTLNNIIPIGKVESREGLVFFRNNEFRIVKATLDFANTEQIKPYFNIVADTRVQNYNIRLMLEGFTDHFNLSLSSDPYLVETDILALLTLGQTGKQLKGMEAGIGAGEAASFLTGKIQDVLEERAKTITGFDRIQIDPTISRTTSTVTPRLTLSKKLMGDKLFVTYSASITTGEEQVWKLEYMIDKRTSIVGVRDERGGLGADVKFRFEFK